MTKLGLRGLLVRAAWEADNRSGFKAFRTPRGQVPMPASVPDFETWWGRLGHDHYLRSIAGPTDGVPPAMGPLDWHGPWPSKTHWTKALAADCGDVRLIWETNRFGWLWEWLHDGLDHSADFEAQVDDWRHKNAFRSGVNWASGQELALRSLMWLHGAARFGGKMSPRGWQRLVELLYWHAVQIEAEFEFARHAVRNNHVLAEGLGLAAIADAFEEFEEAPRWRCLGLEAFTEAVGEQFFDDGGYCQCSHNYHRFALEISTIASRWFQEVRPAVIPVSRRSRRYFEALVTRSGDLPNFGPNDSARLMMRKGDDNRDYRPLLELLGGEALEPPSASFPEAGIHMLRADPFQVTLRCGELPRRGGHSDALHVDIELDERPVAIDAGSYSYHREQHAWFAGARSHNVCMVDDCEPRAMLGRFTWGGGPAPVLREFNLERGLMLASYDAYEDVRWERELTVGSEAVEVTDTLAPAGRACQRTFQLHWLLDCEPSELECERKGFTWNISHARFALHVDVEPLMGELSEVELAVEPADVSWYYGSKTPAVSLRVHATTGGVRFRSRFVRR